MVLDIGISWICYLIPIVNSLFLFGMKKEPSEISCLYIVPAVLFGAGSGLFIVHKQDGNLSRVADFSLSL